MDAGRELDALVAEHVMGMDSQRLIQLQEDGSFKPIEGIWHECPEFSTDIADAWQVLTVFSGYRLRRNNNDPMHGCEVWRDTGLRSWPRGEAVAATQQLAICLAALKAVGFDA